MSFKTLFQKFKYNFCNYAEYDELLNVLRIAVDDLTKIKREQDTLILSQKELIQTKDAIKELQEEQLNEQRKKIITPVDLYCIKKGYKINNFVYRDKIIINGVKISCNLREIITPNSYVVEQIRKNIKKPETKILWYERIMNKVNSIVTWTTDGRDDNYYYPNYTLQTGKGDCDDFAFAQCSIEPELGNAFGFWDRGDGKPIGHSFAVGVIEGQLWIFDAVPNKIVTAEGNPFYSINYIITKNNIYVLDDSVRFGEILWE